jgi:hypothetical protein
MLSEKPSGWPPQGAGSDFAIRCVASPQMSRHLRIAVLLAALLPLCSIATGADPALASVHKIYINKMDADRDQYLRVEFIKRAARRFTVVLDKTDADAVLTGVTQAKDGAMHTVTGRYLGLEDNETAAISLLDPTEKKLIWAGEAGDRSMVFSLAHRNGQRKVAERIMKELMKAAQ